MKQLDNSREFYTLPPPPPQNIDNISTLRKACSWSQDMSPNTDKGPLCFHLFDPKTLKSLTTAMLTLCLGVLPKPLHHCLGMLVPEGELAQWCWQLLWIDHTTLHRCWSVLVYTGLLQTGKESEQKQSSPSPDKLLNFAGEASFTKFGAYPLLCPSSTSLQYIGKQVQEFYFTSIIFLQEEEH